MNETRDHQPWRDRALQAGFVLMWTNISYWAFIFPFQGMDLFSSEKSYGYVVVIGFLLGVGTLVCGLIGKGRRRWAMVTVAFVETLWWWFMAVGL
jgi:hypothetical protein